MISPSLRIIFNEQSHLNFLTGKICRYCLSQNTFSYCLTSKSQAGFCVDYTLKLTLIGSKYMKMSMEFIEGLN